MAIEYRLSYTAQEIDDRLRKTDEIENKQDKLAFDSAPTEGSENLVKSGDIYTAIQNVGGGSVDLVAGDGIEIKDGVIRSTLGDVAGECEEFHEIWSAQEIEMENIFDEWYAYSQFGVDNMPNVGSNINIKFTLPGEDIATCYRGAVEIINDQEGTLGVCHNATMTTDLMPAAIDETAFAFIFQYFLHEDGVYIVGVATNGDYNGASMSIEEVVVEPKYVTLPDNALKAGDFIEIKYGVVSSTLGKTYTTVEQATFYDSGILELEDSYIPDDMPDTTAYDYGRIYSDYFLNVPEVEGEWLEIGAKYYPPNSDEPVTMKGCYRYEYSLKEKSHEYNVVINAEVTEEDFEIYDANFPIINISAHSYPDTKEHDGIDFDTYVLSIGQDISGARIVIDGEKVVKTTVKLPNEALTFDDEPTDGSENLVTSGVVYEALENAQPNLTFDDEPTESSENLVSSGVVYDALQNIEIEPQLNEGIIYTDETQKGFSANKNAYPTADGAWIEGNAAVRSTFIYTPTTPVTLNVTQTTQGKNTITSATIDIDISNASDNAVHILLSEMEHRKCASIVFEDSLETTYYIKIIEINQVEDKVSLKFGFFTNQNTFPINETTSRPIKSIVLYPLLGTNSHSEGLSTIAIGTNSHSEGLDTIARGDCSHVQGRCNVEDTTGTYAHIVGNGGSVSARSNAHTLDWEGNAWYAGYVEGNAFILPSSTEGSTKRFKITVDDGGTLSATEIVESEATEITE